MLVDQDYARCHWHCAPPCAALTEVGVAVQGQLQDRLMEVSEMEDEIAGVHSQLEGQLLQKLDEQARRLLIALDLACMGRRRA